MKSYLKLVILSIVLMASVNKTMAVPPPDFLFNIGAQLVQVFSVAVVFLSAAALSVGQFFKVYFHRYKHKKAAWVVVALIVVLTSFGIAYAYQQYSQDKAYKEWLVKSQAANSAEGNTDNTLEDIKKLEDKSTESTQTENEVVKETEDKKVAFIKKYYADLAGGKVEDAYAVSKKNVDLATYKSWYVNVKSIEVSNIEAFDENKYSFQIAMTEISGKTDYQVLMTLNDQNGQINIADSVVNPVGVKPPNTGLIGDNLEDKKEVAVSISNRDFQDVINKEKDVFVLDAREDEEYEIGQFPESHHIRFADLVAGEWKNLPKDQTVYVFCWSGIRGKEVADFLRSKKINARYLIKGASDWVAFGGKWAGGINFSSKYGANQYQKLFSTEEVKKQMADGVVLVDSRPQSKFEKKHVNGSLNIPMIYTPSSEIASALNKIPAGKSVITVCDDFVSCFDAKITGVKVEKLNHTFLGRYNSPWEYQN